MWSRPLLVAVALGFVPPLPALAQSVEVSPFVGAVIPLANVAEDAQSILGNLEAKHEVGLAFGGRVTIWLPSSLGFEGQAAYALSDGEVKVDGQDTTCADVSLPEDCLNASLFFAAAKVLYRFAPPTGAAAFHIGGGLALVSRSGDAYDTFDVEEGKTDVGGILNIGASFKVGPLVSIRVDAEDYLTSVSFTDSTGEETDSKFQNDVTLTAGVQIAVGR